MHQNTALHLAATMNRCLAGIIEIGRSADLDPAAIAQRLHGLGQVAFGVACPEVDFDPTAVRLRAIDAALCDRPEARDAWRARVRGAIVAASSGAVVIVAAA